MARKQKQGHLNGMEPPSVAAIDAAAEEYTTTRNARMKLLEKEIEKQAVLMELMKRHKFKVYQYDGKTVEVVSVDKVKVRKKKGEGDDDDEDEISDDE